jgi:hypothetical protein
MTIPIIPVEDVDFDGITDDNEDNSYFTPGLYGFQVGRSAWQVAFGKIYTYGDFEIFNDSLLNFSLSSSGVSTIRTSLHVPVGTFPISVTVGAGTFNSINCVSAIFGTINCTTATFGSFTSGSKFFDIPYPSRPGFRIRHGCLEGPELAVYIRGVTSDDFIPFPAYWNDIVDKDSITVTLTPYSPNSLWVDYITPDGVFVNSDFPDTQYSYYIMAERTDIPKVVPVYSTES